MKPNRITAAMIILWATVFFVGLALTAISPLLNAGELLTGNEQTDTVAVHNMMRTLDARAKHCHRVINYMGGYAAAAELFKALRDDLQGADALLGSCVEFVTISTRLAYTIAVMEEEYGTRPVPPAIADRVNAVAFMLYLKTIDKEAAFMRTFTE